MRLAVLVEVEQRGGLEVAVCGWLERDAEVLRGHCRHHHVGRRVIEVKHRVVRQLDRVDRERDGRIHVGDGEDVSGHQSATDHGVTQVDGHRPERDVAIDAVAFERDHRLARPTEYAGEAGNQDGGVGVIEGTLDRGLVGDRDIELGAGGERACTAGQAGERERWA